MSASEIYYFKSGETDARAQWQGDEFVILAGSRVWLRSLPSDLLYIERERDHWRMKGVIDASGLVLADIPLASVSRAACFAYGAAVYVKRTPQAWRTERGERPPMRGRERS